MFFDIPMLNQSKKLPIEKVPNFDCYFKVKKDTYSNKTVIHLEDIH